MLRAEAPGASTHRTDRDRELALAPGHESELRELLDDRVAGRRQEVAEHDLYDRPEPRYRHADRQADKRVLTDRRVLHTPRGALRETVVRLDHPAIVADVLTEQVDPLIGGHLVRERRVHGVAIGHLVRIICGLRRRSLKLRRHSCGSPRSWERALA